ncbi:MAG: hypothetical protein LUH53_09575, partial [Lachnospiraceae bacterium]|nr:hypothetical protein [Lachnospiraceae bacterium]
MLTDEGYMRHLRRQRVFRTIVCIIFCIISLLPFLILCMNATRTSADIKSGLSLIPSTHFLENWNNLLAKQNGMQITLQK